MHSQPPLVVAWVGLIFFSLIHGERYTTTSLTFLHAALQSVYSPTVSEQTTPITVLEFLHHEFGEEGDGMLSLCDVSSTYIPLHLHCINGTHHLSFPNHHNETSKVVIVNLGYSQHQGLFDTENNLPIHQYNAFHHFHQQAHPGNLFYHEVPLHTDWFQHGVCGYALSFFLGLIEHNHYQPILLLKSHHLGDHKTVLIIAYEKTNSDVFMSLEAFKTLSGLYSRYSEKNMIAINQDGVNRRTADLLLSPNALTDEATYMCQITNQSYANQSCELTVTKQLFTALRVQRAQLHRIGLIDMIDHTYTDDALLTIPTDSSWPLYAQHQQAQNYSQGGQDGVLRYIFHHIGVTNKYFVEFGFDSATYEGGGGSNTYNLYKNFQWHGLLFDKEHENVSINLHQAFITPDNLISIFQNHNVPISPDLVSIDVDSSDLWLLQALLTQYRPRVISVEYNSNYPIEYSITCIKSCQWFSGLTAHGKLIPGRLYGASFRALQEVAFEAGYSVVAVITPMDIIFVDNILLTNTSLPQFGNEDIYSPLHESLSEYGLETSAKALVESQLLDWSAYAKTADETEANKAAIHVLQELRQKFKISIY